MKLRSHAIIFEVICCKKLKKKRKKILKKILQNTSKSCVKYRKSSKSSIFLKKNLWVIKMEYSLSSIFRDSSRNPCINYSESILPGSSPEISSSSRNCGIKTFSNSTLISHRCDCYENCSSNKVTHGNSISSFATL